MVENHEHYSAYRSSGIFSVMLHVGSDVGAKVKTVGSGVAPFRFASQLCYLLAVWPWADDPIFLSLLLSPVLN